MLETVHTNAVGSCNFKVLMAFLYDEGYSHAMMLMCSSASLDVSCLDSIFSWYVYVYLIFWSTCRDRELCFFASIYICWLWVLPFLQRRGVHVVASDVLLAASSGKHYVTVCNSLAFVRPSVICILTVTHQGAACDTASVHFGLTIRKTNTLIVSVVVIILPQYISAILCCFF